MNGKEPVPELITPSEALKLFKHSKIAEMYTVIDLYNAYYSQNEEIGTLKFKHVRFLSFIYDTGVVQGMRAARRKRRTTDKSNDKNCFYLSPKEAELLNGYRTCGNNSFRLAAEKLLIPCQS